MFRNALFIFFIILFSGACSPAPTPTARPAAPPLAIVPIDAPQPAAGAAANTPLEADTQNPAPSAKAVLAQPLPAPRPHLIDTEPEDWAAQPAAHLTRRVPIIEYHYSTFRLSEEVRMETDWFKSQLRWLQANGFTALTSAQLVAFLHGDYNPPRRSVVLTFDVGASKFDDYTQIVIPALRRYGLHGIFFILASRTLDSCADPRFTCWPFLKAWADEGIISVGSHSWFHTDYLTLTPTQMRFDASHSKALIEEKTGHPVLGICYPYDSVNPAAFKLFESLGYQFAVAGPSRVERSATANDPEPYGLARYYPYAGNRYPLIGGTGGLTFDQMILGAIDN